MDLREYRRRYEAELTANSAAKDDAVGSARPSAAAFDPNPDITARISEIRRMPLARAAMGDNIPKLLAILRNGGEPLPIREAALHALQAATFLGERFAPFHVDFLAALRQVARPETAPGLRQDALEVLASEKDPAAQELLRRGLQDPRSALVPAAKALQLLGYDDHSGVAGLALGIFHKASDIATKEAALRVLATDAKSQELFAQLLQDKSQPHSLRALSATGLNFLNPQKFSGIAREIVLDKFDLEDIRASCLAALTHTPDHHALRQDMRFIEAVKQLGTESSLLELRATAQRFIENA